jgi:hypothetical protein
MQPHRLLAILLVGLSPGCLLAADVSQMPACLKSLELVGDPGNAADTTGIGETMARHRGGFVNESAWPNLEGHDA